MAQLKDTQTRQALSGWPMIIFYLAMFVFAFHASTRMVAAGDTWVAMACGRHFINHGVDTVEPFSANSHRPGPTDKDLKNYPKLLLKLFSPETIRYWHPTGWVNQNWLTHVFFYWLAHKSHIADAEAFSYNSLVYWKFTIYIIAVFCIYQIGRVLRVNPALSAGFACFAMFVGRTFLDIRPQGFSNLLVAVYILILVLATYRNILYIWLIVPVVVFWCNVHGGYIYAFVMLVPFVLLHFLTSPSKRWFVSIGLRGIAHSIASGLAALIAVIIFNPFHLTNLTHTFVISVSKNAEGWRSVNEWHPAFEWANPVGDEIPFLVMFIIALALFAVWAVLFSLRPRLPAKLLRRRKESQLARYQWPRIDLALLAIAALTVYMAVRSRRFIPIAAIAACPVMAMFVDQAIRMILARHSFYKNNLLDVSPMPAMLQKVLIVAGAGAVLFFGFWWGHKFKRVYLNPWPKDAKLNSVFMRMTASDAKPFFALQFIRDNKLAGNMFNYWTEGGFIAYGQEPRPRTGKTPLQLFMDGRAQAAYQYSAFGLWSDIYAGGPTVQKLRYARRLASASERNRIADWIHEQLKKKNHNVWVFLLPMSEILGRSKGYNSPYLPLVLPQHAGWRLVFMNDRQRLFVDVTTARGRELYDGIFTGDTKFPDEASKLLMLGYYELELTKQNPQTRLQGFEHVVKSFELTPSTTAIIEIVNAARYPYLAEKISAYCRKYLQDFDRNKDAYANEHGYLVKLAAARTAARRLELVNQKNKKLAAFYAQKIRDYRAQEKAISKYLIW